MLWKIWASEIVYWIVGFVITLLMFEKKWEKSKDVGKTENRGVPNFWFLNYDLNPELNVADNLEYIIKQSR